jgi:hypothetical protein
MKRIISLVAIITFLLSATALANTSPSIHQHKWEYAFSSSNTMYYVDVNKENALFPQKNMMVFYTKNYNKDKNVTIINKWAVKEDDKKLYARTEWGKIIVHSTNKTHIINDIGKWSEFDRNSILSKCVLYFINNVKK